MPRPKQTESRYRRRLEVRYAVVRGGTVDSLSRIGFSGNLSLQGVMIRTPRVLSPGTLLRIELRFPQGSLIVNGRVVWAREGPIQWLSTGRVGMGIKFIDPPSELADLIKDAASAREAERAIRDR